MSNKVYVEVQRDHCTSVASTSSLTCYHWIVCCCLFVRSTEGIKQLQTFKLPSSQKILELLLAAPCHRDPVTISVLVRSQSNGYTWEDNIGDGICCIML